MRALCKRDVEHVRDRVYIHNVIPPGSARVHALAVGSQSVTAVAVTR